MVPDDSMPASQVGPFIFSDPILVWLDLHGKANGFVQDSGPYQFHDFIAEKANEFERKWTAEMASEAVRVCEYSWEVRHYEKVKETWELMQAHTPVISQGALWWAPEQVHGVPDLIVHTKWLLENFPECIPTEAASETAPNLGWQDGDGHYQIVDIKFTTNLDSSQKANALRNYAAQVRIYSYMLGKLQGLMPSTAYLVQRQPVDELFPVDILSDEDAPLDPDISQVREQYLAIKMTGENWQPWNVPEMQPNMSHDEDAPWHSAKVQISEERVPGGELSSIYYVGTGLKEHLLGRGHKSREDLLSAQLSVQELQSIPRLGASTAPRIARILEANHVGEMCPSKPSSIPPQQGYELFVDFEDFTNVNVNFDDDWPALKGCEMIFMVGVGWEDDRGLWAFKEFVAESESTQAEQEMLAEFAAFLLQNTEGNLTKPGAVRLFHWSNAERSRMKRAADRHDRPPEDLWRTLPWYDMQKEIFLQEPIGLPGAWDYKLKSIGRALAEYDPEYGVAWPSDLGGGLEAMVMGWKAYQQPNPINSQEMRTIVEYNEIDCKALWRILNWLRSL